MRFCPTINSEISPLATLGRNDRVGVRAPGLNDIVEVMALGRKERSDRIAIAMQSINRVNDIIQNT